MKHKFAAMKHRLAVMLAAAVAATAFSPALTGTAAEEATLSNPRVTPDSDMQSGRKVTWDCIWFGRYPQAEVIPENVEYTALDGVLRRDGDVIASDRIYSALKNASDWDDRGDITLDGEKYRRIEKGSADSAAGQESSYYCWNDSANYHYFKYEPIKWRVLHTDGDQALLLSDIALDNCSYNPGQAYVTWETSVVRSWLNGYGAESNQTSENYSGMNFIGSAFTGSERAAVADSLLENADSIAWDTDGGNDTADKIFLLSESDVWDTDRAEAYGFVKGRNVMDEARQCQSSTYAKAMGIYSCADIREDAGNGHWWLRSPGNAGNMAVNVSYAGWVNSYGSYVYMGDNGVRPALNLNLSFRNLYSYAGTVCSDGSGSGTEKPVTDDKKPLYSGKTEKVLPKGTKLTDARSGMIYTVTIPGKAVSYTGTGTSGAASIRIPASVTLSGVTYQVTGISAQAFAGSKDLKKVVIGDRVASIGAGAFRNCKNLKSVVIGKGVKGIPARAFGGCKALKKITIKSGKLKKAGRNAFKGIHAKAVIKVPKAKLKAYKKLLKNKGQGKKVRIVT